MLIFDFDQVLVDTQALAYLRDSRRWPEYRSNLRDVSPCGGINELLNNARSAGHTLAIVTHSPGIVSIEYTKRENWPISIIIGWHDYRVRKPNPKGIQLAMQKGNAAPENTYHIGDQPTDTEAARRAGIHSIGAAWAAIDPAALLASEPDHYCETVSDLAAFMKWLPV